MLGLKYAYDTGERSRLTLHYQHTDAELDFARPNLNYDTFNARDEDIVTLKYDFQATENIGLFVKAYSHTWDTNYTRIYNVLGVGGDITGRTASPQRRFLLGLRRLRADGHDAYRDRRRVGLCCGI